MARLIYIYIYIYIYIDIYIYIFFFSKTPLFSLLMVEFDCSESKKGDKYVWEMMLIIGFEY